MLGVVVVLSAILAAGCGGPDEKKQKFFSKGKALYEQGDYVKARLEFKNALQVDPQVCPGVLHAGDDRAEAEKFQGGLWGPAEGGSTRP